MSGLNSPGSGSHAGDLGNAGSRIARQERHSSRSDITDAAIGGCAECVVLNKGPYCRDRGPDSRRYLAPNTSSPGEEESRCCARCTLLRRTRLLRLKTQRNCEGWATCIGPSIPPTPRLTPCFRRVWRPLEVATLTGKINLSSISGLEAGLQSHVATRGSHAS